MGFLIGAIKVIFLLGFLILIHEGGHFFVAKLCKVKVREFSIGFGPKLISKQGKETKYTLRAIPFGGYVDMLGEAERADEKGSFSQASIWKRLAIVVAGATVNIIFGIIIYFVLISTSGNFVSLIVRDIEPNYSQNLSMFEPGDKILYINDNKIRLKSDLDIAVATSGGEELNIRILRDKKEIDIKAKPTAIVSKSLGTYFNGSSKIPKVKYIEEDSKTAKAGIQINDIITKIDNKKVETYSDVAKFVKESEDNKVTVEVLRDNENKSFEVEVTEYTAYILGVYLEKAENTFINGVYYGFWDTTYFMKDILQNVKNIFTGNVSMDQMTGPIGISEMVVETSGLHDFIYLMSLISLSLGVTNLLPIPALDGGKIVILIIEAIRRKPLKEEVEINIQMIGFTLLILFSLYISYRDILRIF